AAAASKNKEFDDKWKAAKDKGRKASDEWREANNEFLEAKKKAGGRVGEADLGGIRDNGRTGVMDRMREKLYGKEYGVPEGPETEDQEAEKKKKEAEKAKSERKGFYQDATVGESEERGYGDGKGKRFQAVNAEKVNPAYQDPPGRPEKLDELKAK